MDAPRALTDAELPESARTPENPLADGVFMAHQRAWLEDRADLKLCEKGRRTGITFAEAWDATLIAAAAKSAGGDNYFYIGDTKDKGLEFLGYVKHYAACIGAALSVLEEYLFVDRKADGSTRYITAYRARFASGHRVEALSSRPENIRGLQGIVCIDEAAFHVDVREVIAAVNAMLIWGGKVRIISTHNGQQNPFNTVLTEARAGKSPWSVHRCSFRDAIRAGLFGRVCARNGWTATWARFRVWYAQILKSYGSNAEARDQELFVIPAKGEGFALALSTIEARQVEDYQLVRFTAPEGLVDWPTDRRHAEARRFCEAQLAPALAALPKDRDHFVGEDFGRFADRTDIDICNVDLLLARHHPLIVELVNCPVDVQQWILWWIIDRLPRFRRAVLDANGNGFGLAEATRQKYGASKIDDMKPTEPWYLEHMPDFLGSFAGNGIRLPRHADVRDDLAMLQRVRGLVKVPTGARRVGSDGGSRHGDAAMAMVYADAASRNPAGDWSGATTGADPRRSGGPTGAEDFDDGDEGDGARRGALRRWAASGGRRTWA
ncbi:MAG: hypothetical protein GC168_20580 [Candidatus Hydrogenedens sp.]|nr:hypothetical protein [Candidatus Hydrogenedens sp.]